MAKMITEIAVRFTITYGGFVGTMIAIAGITYMFMFRDVAGGCGLCSIGGAMVVGRSALDKFKGLAPDPSNGIGGGKK